jgi:hypothetical protein
MQIPTSILLAVLPFLVTLQAKDLPIAKRSPLGVSITLGGGSDRNIVPNGIKAGISAGDAYDYFKDHIGWWYGRSS